MHHTRASHMLIQHPRGTALETKEKVIRSKMGARVDVRLLTARDFLENARAASQDAERCRDQLIRLEQDATRLSSPSFEAYVRSSGKSDKMAERVGRMVDRETLLQRRIEADYALLDQANVALYGADLDGSAGLCRYLAPTYADILALRYLNGMMWKEVATHMGYSQSQCRKMASFALQTMDERAVLAAVLG